MKYKKKLYLIALTGGILSLACFLYGLNSREELQYLERPERGAGDQKTELAVELEGKRHRLSVTLKEVPYEESELALELEEAVSGLDNLFLQENSDFEHIIQKVSMPSVYPDSQVVIQWYLDSWDYVDPDGTVKNELLQEEETVSVKVQAVLSLGGESLAWNRQIRICPVESPDTEQKLRMLEYRLLEAQEEKTERIELPIRFLGESVSWYQSADDRWMWMLMLTAVALAVTVVSRRKDAEEARKKRIRGMQLDYPEIVSRLSLYMGAGISTRKAWERIVENYEKGEKEDEERHAAYEEMRITLHEMQSGVAETLAYEQFGTRCRMPAYLKLGTLLSQNLRKGTRNLAELLKEESREAFEDRKALAKRMGEECESRLLLPMIMMLLTILIIIMFPAVISFQM